MIDTIEFKKRLEAEKTRLETELAGDGEQDATTGDWQGSSNDAEPAIDPNEAADQIEELTNNTSIVENLENQLHAVQNALDKIEAGTYGICEVGGEEIPKERLEANPSAATCVTHATA
jgi:RNA polymerase-binding transcription factor DksA